MPRIVPEKKMVRTKGNEQSSLTQEIYKDSRLGNSENRVT